MGIVITLLVAIPVLGIIIFIHELGHFLSAKASGILVHEFALGMGPNVFSRKIGETRYSLRALPIGGFVRMAGEDFSEEDRLVPEAKRFDKKPAFVRAVVIAAGALMNFVLATVIFVLIFVFIGVPVNEPIVGAVAENRPAEQAGIQPGDRILFIQGQEIESWTDLRRVVGESGGQQVEIVVQRGEETLTFYLVPEIDPQFEQAQIGILQTSRRYNLLASIRMGWEETVWFTRQIIVVLVGLFTRQTPAGDVAGPVGLIGMVGEVARTGILNLLTFTAVFSIQIGLFNLLPIPALDGGRLLFIIVEGLRGKPIDPEKESFIHFLGFALLMTLLLLLTFRDLQRLSLF